MSIYIEGAQNTGKTTLIKNVKNRFPSICIMNEIARTVIKEKNISHEDLENNKNNCFKKLQMDILKATFISESNMNNPFISDRSILSPIVYSYYYFGEEYGRTLEKQKEFINRLEIYKNNSIIILLTPYEKYLTFDETKKNATMEDLHKITYLYKYFLKKYNLKHIILDKINEREFIIEKILKDNNYFK